MDDRNCRRTVGENKTLITHEDVVSFYTPPQKKRRGIMLYPPNRLSVRPSVNLDKNLGIKTIAHFVSLFFDRVMALDRS